MNLLFKALNDQTRRDILEMLREQDMTAGDIADKFDMTKPSISHHLSLLKQANLVVDIRKGQFIYYSLNTTVIDDIVKWFLKFNSNPTENENNQDS
ncbi:ArsR family transcriptional regulator [Puteibacter caeruleilacunae]|nr:ArsR family transcriptional regulator [Puteibacter caeruleilacunae]